MRYSENISVMYSKYLNMKWLPDVTNQWFRSGDMDNEKTEILLCGPKKYVESSDCDHICIEGENISFADNARIWGCILIAHFQWNIM